MFLVSFTMGRDLGGGVGVRQTGNPNKRTRQVDISSVYDQSGTPRGNVCEPSDTSVAYIPIRISRNGQTADG